MDPVEAEKLRQRLHDGLCQQLTAALMFAEALRKQLADRAAPELADCEHLAHLLHQSADELSALMEFATESAETDVNSPRPTP